MGSVLYNFPFLLNIGNSRCAKFIGMQKNMHPLEEVLTLPENAVSLPFSKFTCLTQFASFEVFTLFLDFDLYVDWYVCFLTKLMNVCIETTKIS